MDESTLSEHVVQALHSQKNKNRSPKSSSNKLTRHFLITPGFQKISKVALPDHDLRVTSACRKVRAIIRKDGRGCGTVLVSMKGIE